MKTLRLAIITLLTLTAAACATPPTQTREPHKRGFGSESASKRSDSTEDTVKPKAASSRCDSFCKTIQSCAAKVGHEDLGDLLCNLARCETGDKCTGKIHSKNGLYHGPFQFSPQTWRSACHPIFKAKGLNQCLPQKAGPAITTSPGSQTKPSKSRAATPRTKTKMTDICCSSICTAEIISQGGIGNWPHCGPKSQKTYRATPFKR